MDDIRFLLETARRRLAGNRFLFGLHLGLVATAILAVLLVLLAKSSPAVDLPWRWIIGGLGVAALAAGFATLRLGRLSAMSLATLVDERLTLKERISTALAVRERRDAFAQAAVADAVTTAKDPRTREALRRQFAVRAPDASWLGPAIAILAGGLWWLVPQGDLFRSKNPDGTDVQKVKAEAEQAVREVEKKIAENKALEEAMKKQDGPVDPEAAAPKEELKTPEEIKRDAIKKLNELQRKAEELLRSEDAMKMDALKQALDNLDPKDGPANELGEALKEGDFKKAKEELDKLKEKAANASEEEKKKLEAQLKNMSDQLGKLAERQDALEKALQKAGLDSKLATNPQALQQALQNAKNLSQAQREQLEKAMASQQAAQQQLQGMSQAMQNAANQMCKGGQQGQKSGQSGQSGQQGQQGDKQSSGGSQGAGGEMQSMLSDMEATEQMLQAAEAAASEASKQCQGQGSNMSQMAGQGNCNGENNGQKNGWQGGRGRASGTAAASAPTPYATKLEKEKLQRGDGPIIMRQLVEGQTPNAGEATIPAEKGAHEVERSMEQGVNEEQIPAHLRDVHKHYFGEVKKAIEARRAAENGAKPADAKPADTKPADAKPADAKPAPK